ncbi:hypothetical protein LOD99_16266 [Oopsacas minuta]|uniref:Late endosomal/lysosomal adaptor and MAPK and MTOR activator 5 n=1 Tax=Oopsacas minuta TaxID=111878 RepID=A0AAV7K8C0_9METZ|nr:hypothetical protein LOD99_16266 [Oopsacas minuta]
MSSSESLQKMREKHLKGISICDPRGFTMQAEGTLKNAAMTHAAQAIVLLSKLDDVKGSPTIRIETNQGNIHIIERDGDTIAIHNCSQYDIDSFDHYANV